MIISDADKTWERRMIKKYQVHYHQVEMNTPKSLCQNKAKLLIFDELFLRSPNVFRKTATHFLTTTYHGIGKYHPFLWCIS